MQLSRGSLRPACVPLRPASVPIRTHPYLSVLNHTISAVIASEVGLWADKNKPVGRARAWLARDAVVAGLLAPRWFSLRPASSVIFRYTPFQSVSTTPCPP